MKKSKIIGLYTKYIVKSPVLYSLFVAIGIGLFLYITLSCKVEVIKTYEGTCVPNGVMMNELVDVNCDHAYVYFSKGLEVTKKNIQHVEHIDEMFTVLEWTDQDSAILYQGMVKIDLVERHTNLLMIILGLDRKYIIDD